MSRWRRSSYLLKYLGRLLGINLLLVLRNNLLLMLIWNTNFLTGIYQVLKIWGVIRVHLVELGLALVNRALILVDSQPVYVTLQVFMHWTMATRLPRHSSGVNSTWVSNRRIRDSRWASQTWFDTLLNSWVNLTRTLLHSPWLLRTLEELWLEIRLTTLCHARTSCQICVTAAILINLDGVSEVMLLIDYYLIIEMSSSRVCWLRSRCPKKLLARKFIRLVDWRLNYVWGCACWQILRSYQRLLLVWAINDVVAVPPPIHGAGLFHHHFTSCSCIGIQSRSALVFLVARVRTIRYVSVSILLFIDFVQVLNIVQHLGYQLLILSSCLFFVSNQIFLEFNNK